MIASEHRANARDALKGSWGVAVLVCWLANLISGAGASVNVSYEGGQPVQATLPANVQTFLEEYLHVAASAIVLLAVVLMAANLILGGVMSLGKAKYFLKLIDRQEAKVGDLFSCFHRFFSAMLMNLLTGAIIVIGMLLLVVPGILATYGLAMAPYIMAEDEYCSSTDALRRSWDLMSGHKWELFCLEFSFIGWGILASLTLGIGHLFLNPYTEAARASFYRNLTAQPRVTAE